MSDALQETRTTADAEPVIEVLAMDAAARRVKALAERKVRRVLPVAGRPVLHVRVKLAMAPDPAVERPASAEATLDVSGRLIRAHAVAHELGEAVDLLVDRLRTQLVRRARRR